MGQGINKVHRPLVERMGLNETHFEIVEMHLRTSLVELNVEKIYIAEILTRVLSWKDCVLYVHFF